MSVLYIVATPIGNLEDMTFRAVSTLKEVDFVMAEDTRQSKKLFDRYEIETKLTPYYAQTSESRALGYIKDIKSGKSAALISDAGTPGISDPGFKLIQLAVSAGIKIIPIPGASALTTLISAAGVPVNNFQFHGFIPHKKGRQTLIKLFNSEANRAHVCYESVHRFPKLLKELSEYLDSSRIICVGRELTKMHEDIFRGTVVQAQDYFDESNIKGEFVVIIAPAKFKLTQS